jgi:hypothetical protein
VGISSSSFHITNLMHEKRNFLCSFLFVILLLTVDAVNAFDREQKNCIFCISTHWRDDKRNAVCWQVSSVANVDG